MKANTKVERCHIYFHNTKRNFRDDVVLEVEDGLVGKAFREWAAQNTVPQVLGLQMNCSLMTIGF